VRITRLALTDVRRYRQLEVELAPGMTIVRGPNEAGKSTFQRAVEIALTRKVTSTQSDLEAMRPWDGDGDSRPAVALDFVQEDIDGTRRGTLEKAFRGARGSVRLEVDGEVTTDPARAEELLAELTGIPTEPFFRSTASIRHHELGELQRDEAALRDRLQASISGADRGTSMAKRKLERALHDLQTRGERNPGRLKVAEEAVGRSRTLVANGEAQLATLEEDRDALAEARSRRSEAEGNLTESRALLERARQAERLIAERDSARERFERYREAVRTSEEIDRLRSQSPSSHPLPAVRQLVERLRVLDRDIAGLRASLGEMIDVDFELLIPAPVWIRWAALAILLSVGAVAITAVASGVRRRASSTTRTGERASRPGSRQVSCGLSDNTVPMPTMMASCCARIWNTRARACSPVMATGLRPASPTLPSADTANFSATCGRRCPIRMIWPACARRASSAQSPTSTAMPLSMSRLCPCPATSGLGSSSAETTRAMPALTMASTHGGDLP